MHFQQQYRHCRTFGCAVYNNDAASSSTLINCIIWGSTCTNEITGTGTSTTSYSDIRGGGAGVGDIDLDPGFANAKGLDTIAGTIDDDLRLLSTSPCIDTGDNASVPAGILNNLQGHRRQVDDLLTADSGNGASPIVDMGASEYACPGSLDEIAGTTLPDMALLAASWMQSDCGHCNGADFTGDGSVLLDDLVVQVANWLCGTL